MAPFAELTTAGYVAHAGVLALVVGACRAALGLARGGVVAYLMSQPVVSGFTFAAAVLIVASQVPAVLGSASSAANPLGSAYESLVEPAGWSATAIVVAAGVVAVTLLGRRVHPVFPGALLAAVAALLVVRVDVADAPVVGTIAVGTPTAVGRPAVESVACAPRARAS